MCTCIRAAPVLRVRAANARARGRASGARRGRSASSGDRRARLRRCLECLRSGEHNVDYCRCKNSQCLKKWRTAAFYTSAALRRSEPQPTVSRAHIDTDSRSLCLSHDLQRPRQCSVSYLAPQNSPGSSHRSPVDASAMYRPCPAPQHVPWLRTRYSEEIERRARRMPGETGEETYFEKTLSPPRLRRLRGDRPPRRR